MLVRHVCGTVGRVVASDTTYLITLIDMVNRIIVEMHYVK